MTSPLTGRKWGALLAFLLLFACGASAAAKRPVAPRYPAIVIYVGTG